MKAGLASIIGAMAALRRVGLQPAAEVQLAAVIEEECTGNGAFAVMHAEACDGVNDEVAELEDLIRRSGT